MATPTASETIAAAPISAVEVTAAPVEALAADYQPKYHEIADLAYSYWVERGYQDGNSEQDWLRAERELRTRHGRVQAAHA